MTPGRRRGRDRWARDARHRCGRSPARTRLVGELARHEAGMERGLVERHGIAFDAIDFSGLRGKGLKTLLLGGFLLLRALWQSRARCCARERRRSCSRPAATWPCRPGLAASSLGVPLVLMNADAESLLVDAAADATGGGRVVRIRRRRSGCRGRQGARHRQSGTCRDRPMASPEQRFAGRTGPLRLLVIGGSLGAQVLNETVPAALARLPRRASSARRAPVRSRERRRRARRAYRRAGVDAEVVPFIDDMAQRYARGRRRCCVAPAQSRHRTGRGGRASVLVPLVVSTTQHQRTNAEFLASAGAALHLAADRTDRRTAGQTCSTV